MSVATPQSRTVRLAAFAVAVFALGHFAVHLAPGDAGVAAWWPAAGVAVGVVAKSSRQDQWRYLSTLAVMSLLANLTGGRPALVAVGFAVSNTLEVFIAGTIIRGRCGAALDGLADVGRFVAGVAVGAASIGVGAALTVAMFTAGDPLETFIAVVPSHATAVCLIAPFLLARPSGLPATSVEYVAIWSAVVGAAALLFSAPALQPLWILLVPLLVWGVVRLGMRAATAQLLVVGVVATSLISLSASDGERWLVDLQLYVIVCSVLVITVGAILVDRERALRQVVASESIYRSGFTESVVAMMVVRSEGRSLRVTETNTAARSIFGREEGDDCGELLSTDDGVPLRDVVRALDPAQGVRCEMTSPGDRVPRWFDVSVSRLGGERGNAVVALQIVETTQRHDAERRLEHMALVDQLTGLPNVTSLRSSLVVDLERAASSASPVALVAVDIRDFASINEVFGHTTGDQVLAEFAARLRSIVRTGDTVARFGSDRFLLVCPDAGTPAGAIELAERAWQVTEMPIHLQGLGYELQLAIGVAISEVGIDVEQLLSEADLAVRQAKAAGTKSVTLYATELRADAARRLRTLGEVRWGMAAGEFEMFMQPVVDLPTGRVTAAEALIRWRRADGSLLPPGEWLDLVEQSGLMNELGAWVLDDSVRQASEWLATVGPADAPAVHVNVSGRQFGNDGFADLVRATLCRHQYPPELLVIELTETVLATADGALQAEFAALSKIGVRLAADDFGTGYSPLTRVTELPLHMIKIDKVFVQDVTTDHRARAIVSSMTRLANELGLDVVAEGVETEEQLAVIREIGCRAAQGYLWSPALDASSFASSVLAPIALRQLGVVADR